MNKEIVSMIISTIGFTLLLLFYVYGVDWKIGVGVGLILVSHIINSD